MFIDVLLITGKLNIWKNAFRMSSLYNHIMYMLYYNLLMAQQSNPHISY